MSGFLYGSLLADSYGVQLFGDNNVGITPEGGYAVKLINNTGADSIKGTIVQAGSIAESIAVSDSDAVHPIGVIFNSGIQDGSYVWVVVSGVAQVLLKDTESTDFNYWVYTSDTEGRAITAALSPGADPSHFREIGHSLEKKSAGTNVLFKAIIHFN
jgi:hypothetical protein